MVQFFWRRPGPDPDFIHFEPGFRCRFYRCSPDPGPGFINGESGFHSGSGPDFIHF